MLGHKTLTSRNSDEWSTPQWLFDSLNKEFGFTLDPCSNGNNQKCEKHYTINENGLLKDWSNEVVFMNPPYSKISDWMAKAFQSARMGGVVVCLIPSRTDTRWWHKFCMRAEIRFIKGRLRFGSAKENAPFPSAVIVFRPREFCLKSMEQTA